MKFNEVGRSMVEMLGVLAIIGVLSVGAIAGYSKAMMKYKLNKHAYQISQLINTIHMYQYQFQFDVKDNRLSLIPYFQKLNVIPEGMTIAEGDGYLASYLKDSFGSYNAIYLHADPYSAPYNDQLVLRIGGEAKLDTYITFADASVGIEYCKNVLNSLQPIFRESRQDIHYIRLITPKETIYLHDVQYDFANMSIAQINNICEIFSSQKKGYFLICFRKYPS